MQKTAKTKLCGFAATVLAISLLAIYGLQHEITIAALKDYTQSFGNFAPAIYILIFTLVPLTLIPNSLVAIAGGALFGFAYGALYTVIGAICGATLSFGLARYFGKTLAEKLIRNKVQWLSNHAEQNGFLIVLLLRLIPIVPFDAISYGAGLSRIHYRNFLSATCIGILPGVFVYSNIGYQANNIHSQAFCFSIVILVALIALSHFLKKRYSLASIQKLGVTS